MPNEKLFTAKEAAQAVLAKTHELLAKAALAGAPADQTPADGVQKDPNPAAPNDKMNGNPAPGAFPQNQEKFAAEGLKGHLKLAKFVGRMDEKRKAKQVAPAAAPIMAKSEISSKHRFEVISNGKVQGTHNEEAHAHSQATKLAGEGHFEVGVDDLHTGNYKEFKSAKSKSTGISIKGAK